MIKKLSEAINQSQVSIIVTDKDGCIEYANPKFSELTGFELDEVVGKKTSFSNFDFISEDLKDELWKTVKSGKVWNGVLKNKRKNGELFWESANISPIKNDEGKITNFVAVKEDITEKVKSQEELEKYKQGLEKLVAERTEELHSQYNFLRTLIDTIPNPVFVKNIEGEYTEINKAFEEFYNISREELIGKNVSYIAPEEVAEKTRVVDNELLDKPGQKIYETFHITGEGRKRNLLIYKGTFGRSQSTPEGVAGLVLDITDQKELEQKTKDALKHEIELNEMKTSFISMASHEFRTPLTSILASADLLEMYFTETDNVKISNNVNRIQKAVVEMVDLLDGVLTLSRTDRGKIGYNASRTNIVKLIETEIEQIKRKFGDEHKIICDLKFDREFIIADKKLIADILDNLMSNAIKFSPELSSIYLRSNILENGNLYFEIEDEGKGIPESEISYIFNPFFRANNAGSIPGKGLGLSIVKKFVEIHSGSIKVESKLDEGTKIKVELKLSENNR